MSVRRSTLGLIAAAAVALSGCEGGTVTAPSVAIPSVPASLETGGLEGFCADFAAEIQADWPNIDQSTATSLGPVVSQWLTTAELSTIATDVQTIGTWLTTAATSTSLVSPPPTVDAAFENIETFSDNNC